jgi:23S rRNA pseudouridine1911/1915/1917 synthase
MGELNDVELLYEVHPCLVVCKPGALLTQGPPGVDSLEVRIRAFLQQRDSREGRIYLGVPHRLDRPASGALVLARNVRATRRLAEQFEMRTVEKTYWVLVEGHVQPERGTWRDFMRKIPDQARAEIVSAAHPQSRLAILRYQVLRYEDRDSWLEVRLETGRTHQIRVQTASRGHPVLGDWQYGSSRSFGPQADDVRDRWIALHARQLAFDHPKSRERVVVTAALPAIWERSLT